MPRLFDFYPKSWVLPREHKQFLEDYRAKKKKRFHRSMTKGKMRSKDISAIMSNQNSYYHETGKEDT